MSGTSMDAVDAVVTEHDDGAPPRLLGALAYPHSPALRARLAALTRPGAHDLSDLATADAQVGELFADAALAVIGEAGLDPEAIRAIGSHGQTLRHFPAPPVPQSLQIGDPNRIAERTGITVVADFRRRDLAAGGQGAPLVPAFHQALFRSSGRARAVLNLGGIANLTLLPAAPEATVVGFDVGPGNTLSDAWVQRHLGTDMDRGGTWAAGGRVSEDLLRTLLADPYLARPAPKSTGPDYFNLEWLEARLQGMAARPEPRDVQATLIALTATSITHALRERAWERGELVVCGGGVHNDWLMHELRRALPPAMTLCSSAALGVDPDWMEAMAFAWLARESLEGRPGNLPTVTGARHPVVLGGIYPGGEGTRS